MKLLKQTLIATAVTAVMASSSAMAGGWMTGPLAPKDIFAEATSTATTANTKNDVDLSYQLDASQGLLAGDRVILNLTNNARFNAFPNITLYDGTTGLPVTGGIYFSLDSGLHTSTLTLRVLKDIAGTTRISFGSSDAQTPTSTTALFDISGVTGTGTVVDINITTANSGGTAIGGISSDSYAGDQLPASFVGICNDKGTLGAPGAGVYCTTTRTATPPSAPVGSPVGTPATNAVGSYLFKTQSLFSCIGSSASNTVSVKKQFREFLVPATPTVPPSSLLTSSAMSHTLTNNGTAGTGTVTGAVSANKILYKITSTDAGAFNGLASITALTPTSAAGVTPVTFGPAPIIGATLAGGTTPPTGVNGIGIQAFGTAGAFTYDPITNAAYAVTTVPLAGGGNTFTINPVFTLSSTIGSGNTSQNPRTFTLSATLLDDTIGGWKKTEVNCNTITFDIKRDGSSFTMNAFGPRNVLKITEVNGDGPAAVTFRAYNAVGALVVPRNPLPAINSTTGIYVPANGTVTIPGTTLIDTSTVTPLTATYGSDAIRFDVFVESSAIKASSVKTSTVKAGTLNSDVTTSTVYTNRIQSDTSAAGAL